MSGERRVTTPGEENNSRKERKDRKRKKGTKRFLDVRWCDTHYVLPDLKFVAAKVHQKAVLFARGSKVAQYLSSVFIGQSPAGFEFCYQGLLDEKIGEVFTDYGSVFIEYRDWTLLPHIQTGLSQAMGQRVFVYFF